MQHHNFASSSPESPAAHCVMVLGASPKPGRYSNQAVRLLKDLGYRVVPVHPKAETIAGLPAIPNLRAFRERVQTLTLYVGPARSRALIDDIVRLQPGRVILNPGTESELLEQCLRRHHIPVVHGCTLVMLRTAQF